MPDYGEILVFLASNPPQFAAERELHASLLELLAKCLRTAKEGDIKLDEFDPGRSRKSGVN
jgi:hypothetical protein